MNRLLAAPLLLLGACTFELPGGGSPLVVVVSEYPAEVAWGDTFEVTVDVLAVTEPLEVAVTPPEGVEVAETVGPSYAILTVAVGRRCLRPPRPSRSRCGLGRPTRSSRSASP